MSDTLGIFMYMGSSSEVIKVRGEISRSPDDVHECPDCRSPLKVEKV